jgi:hypothetical protein
MFKSYLLPFCYPAVPRLGGRRILPGRWIAFLGGLALLLLAALLTPSPAFAADDIPISTAENVQTGPAVAHNSLDEEYLVVWQDHRFGPQEFYGQRVSSSGQLLGGEIAIMEWPVSDSKAIVYGNGGYLFVWLESTAGYSATCYGLRLTDEGVPAGNEIELTTTTVTYDRIQTVHNQAQDKYLVVWLDTRAGIHQIYGRHVSSDGQLDAEVLLVDRDAKAVAVTYNTLMDEYLVVWAEYDPQAAEDIFGQRLRGDDLSPLDGVLSIYEGSGFQGHPAVAYSPSANQYLVVWSDDSGAFKGARGQRISADGVLEGPLITVSDTSDTGVADLPDLIYQPGTGAFLAAWDDERTSNSRVYGQWVGDDGALLGENFTFSEVSSWQSAPRLASSETGAGYLVVWGDLRNDGGDIYGNGELSSSILTVDLPPLTQNADGWVSPNPIPITVTVRNTTNWALFDARIEFSLSGQFHGLPDERHPKGFEEDYYC